MRGNSDLPESGDSLPAAHVWLRSPSPGPQVEGMPPTVPVDVLWSALHQLPVALTVAWGRPSQVHDYTVVRVALDPAEMQEALGHRGEHCLGHRCGGRDAGVGLHLGQRPG